MKINAFQSAVHPPIAYCRLKRSPLRRESHVSFEATSPFIEAAPSQIRLFSESLMEESPLSQSKPDSSKSSSSHHAHLYRSASINSYPLENECEGLIITDNCSPVIATAGRNKHKPHTRSLSHTNTKKEEETITENENECSSKKDYQSRRNRRLDRMCRLIPALLHRHSKKKNVSKLEDIKKPSEVQQAIISKSNTWVQRGAPACLHQPFETASLGCIAHVKSPDAWKYRRPPLNVTPFGSGISAETVSGEPATQIIEPTSDNTEPLFATATQVGKTTKKKPHRKQSYTVACQHGVCTFASATLTEGGELPTTPSNVQTFGKKLQVGKSFMISPEREVESMQASQVYANLPSTSPYIATWSRVPELYDIGVQAGFPNRLRGMSCRLEFDQPGVELGGNLDPMPQTNADSTITKNETWLEEKVNAKPEANNMLRFRVAFANQASTL